MTLTEQELSEIVEHAKTRRWGRNNNNFDYADPMSIMTYCSERIAQLPFQLSFPTMTEEEIARKLTKLDFFNGIIGRVAHLERGGLSSSSHSHFYLPGGENQIDLFLARLGYIKFSVYSSSP